MTYSSWSVVDIWHSQGLDCWDQNIRRDWADCDCVLAATQQLVVASNSSCAPPASLLSASTDHRPPPPPPSPHWKILPRMWSFVSIDNSYRRDNISKCQLLLIIQWNTG